MVDTVSDLEQKNLLLTAPGAVATDTLADLRLKQFKSATVGLATVSDYETEFLKNYVTTDAPSDTLYDLRRKYYMQKGSLSGVGLTSDDLHYIMEAKS